MATGRGSKVYAATASQVRDQVHDRMSATAQERPAAVTSADIAEYLETADDFAFEREVYHVANGLGFQAEHAAIYKDGTAGKARQFDVRASFTRGEKKISLAIECKGLTPDFPLLVSCVPRPRNEAWHEILSASDTMALGASYTRVTKLPSGIHLYPVGRGVGKSMRQVRRDTRGKMVSGDDVFDKWMQALASLEGMIESGADQLSAGSQQKLRQIGFLPVLVVSDETLWVADYSSNGALEREPFQVPELTYHLGRKYDLKREQTGLTITHLHIITRSEVRSWLQGISQGGGIWQELFGAPWR